MRRGEWDREREKIDIVEYALKHFHVYEDGLRYKIVCPFHGDTDPSLVLYPTTQSWHCFGCNRTGDVFDFIGHVENRSLKDIFEGIYTGEIDLEYLKRILYDTKRNLTIDSWYMIGCIALRGLRDREDWNQLAKSLDEATLEDVEYLELKVLGILSKTKVVEVV
jgi:hypothetical protein